jgi:chemotaxis protein methyltransferase CheR
VKLPAEVLARALELIAARLGLQFPESRHPDIERGLLSVCRQEAVWPPEALLVRLAVEADDSTLWVRLIAELTIGETFFFRDRAVFTALEFYILPALIAARRAKGIRNLRLWSAGCATGEEPYSLAILLDRLLPDRAEWSLTILATDINVTTLQAAIRGCYRAWAMRETPPEIRDRYFLRQSADFFELRPEIRRMVTFAPLNLATAGYPSAITNTSAMDFILCRNVLMYLGLDVQRAAVARLSHALVPGGRLAVSPAEASAELLNPLVAVSFPGAIFYRREVDGGQGLGDGDWGMGADSRSLVSGLESLFSASLESGIKGNGSGGLLHEAQELRLDAAGEHDEQRPTPTPQSLSANPQPPSPVPQPPLDRARFLADQGNLEEARHLCDDALAKDRLNPRAYLLLAAIQQEQGEVPDALDALRRAVYLDPDAVMPHFLQGSLLLRQGKQKQGVRCMETVMRLLGRLPREELLPDGDGLTAGHLMEMAQEYAAIRAGSGIAP